MPSCRPGNVAVGETYGESARFAALQVGVNALLREYGDKIPYVADVPTTGVIGPQTATAVHELLLHLAGYDYGVDAPVARLAYLGNDACAIAANAVAILGVFEEELRLMLAPGDRPSALLPVAPTSPSRAWLWVVGGLALAGVIGAVVLWPRKRRR